MWTAILAGIVGILKVLGWWKEDQAKQEGAKEAEVQGTVLQQAAIIKEVADAKEAENSVAAAAALDPNGVRAHDEFERPAGT